MRAVAEEHGARPTQMAHNTLDLANRAVANGLSGYMVMRLPAIGMVHGHDSAIGLAGFNHTCAFIHRGSQGLFTDNPFDFGIGGSDDDVGVAVVRSADAQDIQIFLLDHGLIGGVGPHIGHLLAPGLLHTVKELRLQFAHGDKLCLG